MSYLDGKILENRYQIEEILGQGGMGAVYRGFDTKLKIPVAVKENFLRTPESIQLFEQEGLLLARLRHPNLPRVIDHFTFEERQYLVMDFIEGQNLWDIIKTQDHPLSLDLALHYIKQINHAVNYLHEQEPAIIHRDIKPHNIKITSKGEAVLVDFGIAKVDEQHINTSSAARSITPGYSPPEQYSGSGTTLVTDVYSLGATLYAILTAQQPPDSIHLITGKTKLTFPPPPHGSLPLELQQAIIHAMQPHPNQRPDSVARWQMELDAAIEGQTISLPDNNALTVPSKTRSVTPPPITTVNKVKSVSQPITQPMPVIKVADDVRPPIAPPTTYAPLLIGITIIALMVAVGVIAYTIGSSRNQRPTVDNEATMQALITFATAQAISGTHEPNINLEGTITTLAALVAEQALTQQAQLAQTATPLPVTATPTPITETPPAPTATATVTPLPTNTATLKPSIPLPIISPQVATTTMLGKIAFYSGRTGNGDIYIMNPDGTALFNVTRDNFGADQEAALSFDGQRVVFSSYRNNLLSLYLINVDGTGLTPLTDKNYHRPAWSPNGQEVVFDIGSRLDITHIDRRPGRVLAQVSGESHPAWSPDGAKIAFETEHSANNVELFLINQDGSGLTRLTNSAGINERYPAWSPDGTKIAFVSDNGGMGDDIYIMNSNGNQATRLTFTPSGQQWANRHPTWSPDGNSIAFASRRDGNDEIYLMALDGSGLTNLTNHPADDNYPSWQR